MRRAQIVLLVLLSAGAGLILAQAGRAISRGEWLGVLFLSVLLIASDRLSLFDFAAGRLSFLAGGVMVAFVTAGADVTLWAVAAATVAGGLIKGSRPARLLFNLAQLTVTSAAAFAAYRLTGGGPGAAAAHPLAVVATGLTFMLLNAGLYGIYLYAGAVMPLHTALRTLLDPAATRAYLIIMTVGVLAGFAFVAGGWGWALQVAGLAYMLQSTIKRYFEAVRQAKSQAQQLEAVLNATEGALIMTDQTGRVQVANRRVGDLFGVDLDHLVGKAEAEVPTLQQVKARIAAGTQTGEQIVELDRSPARFLHWYRAELSSQVGDLQGHIEVFTDVTALKQAEQNLRELYDSTIRALTAAIDARDSYTHGHSGRVSAYAVAIARQLGLPQGDRERIRYSGLLHDIGKLGVDDHVLRKSGALSPSERALMMQHPVIGASVLEKAPVLADLIPGVRWHHEWISGGGYPDGLKGPEIPLDARIIGVADAFDAMTSHRPYRPALSRTEALARIRAAAGEQFDPVVADALMALADVGELPAEEAAGALRNPETGALEWKAAAGMPPQPDHGPAKDTRLIMEALAADRAIVREKRGDGGGLSAARAAGR